MAVSYYNRTESRGRVHCIEPEPELQATLRGLGYPLVGTDFLTFWPDEKYDLIVQDVVWVSPRLDITDKIIKALSEGNSK